MHGAALSKKIGAAVAVKQNSVLSPLPWSPPVVQLAARLVLWPDPQVRRGAAGIYCRRPSLSEAELGAALRSLVQKAIGETVQTFAEAMGINALAFLQFVGPACPGVELSGTFGRLRCLDRIWGGPALQSLESIDTLQIRWPGNLESMIVQSGTVWLDGKLLPHYERVWLPAGCQLLMDAGSTVLLSNLQLTGLLEAAGDAGIPVGQGWFRPEPTDSAVPVGHGDISMAGSQARFKGRKLNLSASEAKLLRLLILSPGVVVARSHLARELNLKSPTGIERVIVSLRNKLGDGVIRTVYGEGYLLD